MPAAIRPARATDIDALAALEQAVFAGDRISRRSFSRLIGRPTTAMLVAEDVAGPAGYCLVLFREQSAVARLYSIATDPSRARSGVGLLLLEAAEGAALERGCMTLRLEVREDNARAIGLYERNGYRRIGSRPDYYEDGATALRFEKTLGGRVPAETNATVGRRAAR